jgi:hypothetical protein
MPKDLPTPEKSIQQQALLAGFWVRASSKPEGITWIWIIHALAETLAITILIMTTVH